MQYVTNEAYLCNSLMILETLHRLDTKVDRVLMYPADMMDPDATEPAGEKDKLLIKAMDIYGAKLTPVAVQSRLGRDDK